MFRLLALRSLLAALVCVASAGVMPAAASAVAPSVRIAGVSAPPSLEGDEVVPTGRATGRAGLSSAHLGARSVLVMRVRYEGEDWPATDDLDASVYGTASVQQRLTGEATAGGQTSASAMFASQSAGAFTLTGAGGAGSQADVAPWFDFPGDYPRDGSGQCNADAVRVQAQGRADDEGIPWRDYDHLVIVFPLLTSGCGWAGLGQIGGRVTWINGLYEGAAEEPVDSAVIAHELGHNLGVRHAASLACTTTSADPSVAVLSSTACVRPKSSANTASTAVPSIEYGDPFEMMGTQGYIFPWRGTELMSTWRRAQLEQLPDAGQQVVTAAGTYTLAKASASSGTRLIRLVRGVGAPAMAELSLEYRPSGAVFDRWAADVPAAPAGVLVRLNPAVTTSALSYLLDGTPSTPQQYVEAAPGAQAAFDSAFRAAWRDAALQPGHTLIDEPSGLRITVTAVTANAATVELSGGALSSLATPTPAPTSTPGTTPTPTATPAPTQKASPTALPAATPASSPTPVPTAQSLGPTIDLVPPAPPTPTPGPTPVPTASRAPLPAARLISPVVRRGSARLGRSRKVTVSVKGAGQIKASFGARWSQTRTGSRVTFQLPVRAAQKSTIRLTATGGSLAVPVAATLRVRRGVLRLTAG